MCLILFFIIYRKRKIIKDTSYNKTILVLLGTLLYFIGLNFNRFSDYTNCSINFIFKHCGIILLFLILFVFIATNIELGLDVTIQNAIKMRQFKYISSINSNKIGKDTNSGNNIVIKSNESSLDSNTKIKNKTNTNSNSNDESFMNSIDVLEKKMRESLASGGNKPTSVDEEKESNYKAIVRLNKNIAVVHSLNFEFIFLYIFICILFAVVVIIFKVKDNNEYLQDFDKRWRYECPLNKFNMAINLIEFLLIIYLVTMNSKIWNYTLVFKYTRNISYMSVIWMALGPFINVKFSFYIFSIII